ncbi:MAG: glycosyltransferase family 2 protein [archaeon]
MIDPYDISLFIYNLALVPLVFFSALFVVLSFISIFIDKGQKTARWKPFAEKDLPFITVQIPVFNDPIAARCVSKCLEFDYPRKRYEIIIADDSTNPKTRRMMEGLSLENPGQVKYVYRSERTGFKPGALKNAMSFSRGEFIVVFDSDWIPKRDFLRKIIEPFSDSKVAIVQSKQGFYNRKANVVTRFAAYLLIMYHSIIMPINSKVNSVFFCGTAGALRRTHFEEVGGWNPDSVTEDCEISVKLLARGYTSVYLDYETPSEVPDTFEAFLKQQMRWCYGNTRVFIDNFRLILFEGNLGLRQRFMMAFNTLGNGPTVPVVIMTCAGMAGWFLGEVRLFVLSDLFVFGSRLLVTGGFLFGGFIALHKRGELSEWKDVVFMSFTIGLVVAFANAFAFMKAVLNQKINWFCTPKAANVSLVSE